MVTKKTAQTSSKTTPEAARDEAAPPATSKEATLPVKLPELLDKVAEATGTKRSTLKPLVEAMLAAMADQLQKGNDLTVPPLGRLKYIKHSEDGATLTLKLRAPVAANQNKKEKDALAADED